MASDIGVSQPYWCLSSSTAVIQICQANNITDMLKEYSVPVAQMVEHGASSAKVMGSIPSMAGRYCQKILFQYFFSISYDIDIYHDIHLGYHQWAHLLDLENEC